MAADTGMESLQVASARAIADHWSWLGHNIVMGQADFAVKRPVVSLATTNRIAILRPRGHNQ